MKVIRVAEKNNFDFTPKELKRLKDDFSNDGKIFVNSNSFTIIKPDFPSIVTVNPYFVFNKPSGDRSNIKAYRLKMFDTNEDEYIEGMLMGINLAKADNVPLLITFQRFLSRKSMEKYTKLGEEAFESYKYRQGWYRPTKNTRKELMDVAKSSMGEPFKHLFYVCDEHGTGCPSCLNCIRLTYPEHLKDGELISLNLSLSGNNGVCKYNCPDCWAKRVVAYCASRRPQCDKLFSNRKQQGKIKHD